MFSSFSITQFVSIVCCKFIFHIGTLKIALKFLRQFFKNSYILFSTLMSSNFCVSSNSNKSKTHVIINVGFNRVASRASTSTNPNISKIDHVDITINEKGEKESTFTNKK
jgi:hypothetical protein